MKRALISIILFAATVLLNGSASSTMAQAVRSDEKQGSNRFEKEIVALRSELAEAIRRRDTRALARIYADDFTHTHASGQVDDKTRRIAALVSGEPTIESATVDEMKIRIYNRTTAVVIGQSTISSPDGSPVKYRWTTVYVKRANRWQIIASHATRITQT
ncbi:MAG: nuclear transport factor 2 family protein [Pyrinomonadaceae bacterium]